VTTQERNARIQEICERALAEDANARPALLRDLCADDEALRREVESLLAHATAAASFMETPALEHLASLGASALGRGMLVTGTRIGQYEVRGRLGAGGMGEVYRAHDARLGREVAIKVLPRHLVADENSRARFEHEARMLAALNHPHIAAIYGVEESDSGPALILELVAGESLAARLHRLARRGQHGLSLADALTIGRQIAEALEAAHEKGIIHRDLKPANVEVMTDGTVKVLDFGVAKFALQPHEVQQQGDGWRPKFAQAPSTALTGHGMIVGTPRYMSPEQIRGEPLDQRADIWAFGCVLYETLTGAVSFSGETTSETVAAILEREPDWSALPAATPAPIRQLLLRCLRKDPKKRLRDIGDARLEIEETHAGSLAPPLIPARRIPWRWLGACAGAAGIAAATVWMMMPTPANPPPRATRFMLPAPGFATADSSARHLIISPDGTRFLYTTSRGLVIRQRDRLDEDVVAGPVAGSPFFSPDGQWIGFATGGSLRKVSIAGGEPVVLATTAPGLVGSWRGNEIVFANVDGIFRVSSAGGTPEKLRMPEFGSSEQASYPEMLPGSRAVLFTVMPTRANAVGVSAEVSGSRIEVLTVDSGVRRTLLRGASRAHYVPTGHLVYAASGSLFAVPFDLAQLEVRGEPVQLATAVTSSDFAVADDGTLMYVTDGGSGDNRLVWVDRQGHEEQLEAPPRPYLYPRLSPDGTRVALDVGPPNRDIWIWDLTRRVLERFTVDPASNPVAAWSRDGKLIAFGSDRFGATNMFVQPSDGRAEARRLLTSNSVQIPLEFAPDGRLLFVADVPNRRRDLQALTLDGSDHVESLVHSAGTDGNVTVSPDGHWIAYDSDESGQYEVFVRPYPNTDSARWQVSVGGGRQPLWSRDGHELYYRNFAGAVISTAVVLAPTFSAGPVVTLLDGSSYTGRGSLTSGRTYDLSLDGRRFLMIKPVEAARPASIVVVLDWFTELRRRVPVR
jgi:serine/threonine-protein kinase